MVVIVSSKFVSMKLVYEIKGVGTLRLVNRQGFSVRRNPGSSCLTFLLLPVESLVISCTYLWMVGLKLEHVDGSRLSSIFLSLC